MSGASSVEELEKIIQMAGFEEFEIMTKPVSREYEERWGKTLSIGEYIMSGSDYCPEAIRISQLQRGGFIRNKKMLKWITG